MSNGLRTRDLPKWITKGIESAFHEWQNISGEWLNSAPEYLVSVHIAQQIKKNVAVSKRTIFLEPSVSKTLTKAGGIQRGPNATKLRSSGRYDIAIGHKDMRPRSVIEVKSPVWNPMQRSMVTDLNRLCKTLLQNKDGTQIHSALMAIYVSSQVPKRIDNTAKDWVVRKWKHEMPERLKSCKWAKSSKGKFLENLNFKVHTKFHPYQAEGETFAWGSVCIEITRKPTSQLNS